MKILTFFVLLAIGTGCGKKQEAIGPEDLTCNGVRTITPDGQTCTEQVGGNPGIVVRGDVIGHGTLAYVILIGYGDGNNYWAERSDALKIRGHGASDKEALKDLSKRLQIAKDTGKLFPMQGAQ